MGGGWDGGNLSERVRDSKSRDPRSRTSLLGVTPCPLRILHTFYPDRLPFSCNFESRLQARSGSTVDSENLGRAQGITNNGALRHAPTIRPTIRRFHDILGPRHQASCARPLLAPCRAWHRQTSDVCLPARSRYRQITAAGASAFGWQCIRAQLEYVARRKGNPVHSIPVQSNPVQWRDPRPDRSSGADLSVSACAALSLNASAALTRRLELLARQRFCLWVIAAGSASQAGHHISTAREAAAPLLRPPAAPTWRPSHVSHSQGRAVRHVRGAPPL